MKTTKSLNLNDLAKTITGKNGLPTQRAIAYAFIKGNNLMDKFAKNHDRNFTNCPTSELQKFCDHENQLIINRANREAIKAAAVKAVAPKACAKKSATEAILEKAKGVVKNCRTKSSK